MCASCSSLTDGMQDLAPTGCAAPALFRPTVLEKMEDEHGFEAQPQAVELAAHVITSGSS